MNGVTWRRLPGWKHIVLGIAALLTGVLIAIAPLTSRGVLREKRGVLPRPMGGRLTALPLIHVKNRVQKRKKGIWPGTAGKLLAEVLARRPSDSS